MTTPLTSRAELEGALDVLRGQLRRSELSQSTGRKRSDAAGEEKMANRQERQERGVVY